MADNTLPKVAETALPAAAMENVTHFRVVSTDNSEKLPKSDLTIAGTKVTVAVDGLSGTVDGAFGDVLTAIAEKADTTQVEALDAAKVNKTGNETIAGVKTFSSSPVVPTPTTDMQAATKKYGDDILAAYGVDVNNVCGAVNHYKRVLADGGTVRSRGFMQRVFEANKDLLADTELLFVPEAGMKVTDGKIEKLYNLVGTNDAVQATEGNRPYVGGVIADGEKAKMKVLGGDNPITLSQVISRQSNEAWSITFNQKLNSVCSSTILKGDSVLLYNNNSEIRLYSSSDAIFSAVNNVEEIGTFNVITIQSDGLGNIMLYKNGKTHSHINESKALVVTDIFGTIYSNGYTSNEEMGYITIQTRCLSVSEIQSLHSFLSTEFPAIETIPVGSQQVATSNLEATVFGAVNVPEVTDNSAWVALTTPAWSHYENSAANGAIYGKLYNGYAVEAMLPYTPTGFHVPSELEWTQLSESLGGNTVSGGKLKALYGGFNNAFATNESGVSLLAGGYRTGAGSFSLINDYNFGRTTQADLTSVVRDSTTSFSVSPCNAKEGMGIRLFSNTPHLTTDKFESGLFATDISSTPKSIRIPFGCKVTNIKCVTSTNVTAIEAKLFNYAGTELETLITGKACNATTKSFSVTADQTVSYTDNYVRVTASGNGGVGMNIIVTIEPV